MVIYGVALLCEKSFVRFAHKHFTVLRNWVGTGRYRSNFLVRRYLNSPLRKTYTSFSSYVWEHGIHVLELALELELERKLASI